MLLALLALSALAQDAPTEADAPAEGADPVEAAPSDEAAEPVLADAPVAPVAVDGPASSTGGVLQLLYTGATGGVGGSSVRFGRPAAVEALLAKGDEDAAGKGRVVATRGHFGTMARGRELLVAAGGKTSTLKIFLEGEPTCDGKRGGRGVIEGRRRQLIDSKTAPTVAEALGEAGIAVDVWTCKVGSAEVTYAAPAGAELPTDWTGFELRLGIRESIDMGKGPEATEIVGVPSRDATRRVRMLRELKTDGVMFVDGGSFVDGIAAIESGVSPHRASMFQVLRDLEPTALVPGDTELAFGADAFLAEKGDLPYVATNWEAEGSKDLPSVLRVDSDAGDVAFLGLIDPEIGKWRKADADVSFSEPVAAAQAAINELLAADEPPDVIVVLTSPSPALLGRLQSELDGADLIIGDEAPRTDRLSSWDIELREPWDAPAPAWTFPLDGVGLAELTVADDTLGGVSATTSRVTSELEPDESLLASVQAVRFDTYPGFERPLIPADPASPTAPISDAVWTKAICEAVLDRSGADFAILPPIPSGVHVPGPLSELLVMRRLELLDVLEIHEADGGLVKGMVSEAAPVAGAVCGVDPGGSKVRGRPIESARLYRVVTTDRAMANTTIAGAIRGAEPKRLLDLPASKVLQDNTGRPLTLASAAMGQLREMRDTAEEDDNILTELTSRNAGETQPGYVFRINSAAVGIEGFQGVEDDRYANIPETLATSPSSSAISTNLDIGLGFSNKRFDWLLRQQAMYTRLVTDLGPQESADDLRTTAKLGFPGVAFNTGPLAWQPTIEGLLDSEITPTEDDEGNKNLRQAELSATLGLDASVGIFTFHAGAFTLRDLANGDKPLEFGGRFKAGWALDLGYGLKWTTSSDTFVWADTPEQDDSDLRLRSLINSDVAIPLARWLSLKTYGQVFVFRGRFEEGAISTKQTQASYTLGTALDLSGAFVF